MKCIDSTPIRPDPTEGACLAICHDLRSPLATAAAAVHELERELGAQGPAKRYVAIARASLAKADELLGALPDLLTRRQGERRPIPLSPVVEAVRDDLRLDLELAGGKVRVVGALPRVLADPSRLRTALRNLVHNAIRHRRVDVPPDIAVRAWVRGDMCTLTITDNGIGIGTASPQSRPGGGLGIGLSIAHDAIEASGGRLSLAAGPCHGTVAAITLPVATVRDVATESGG